MLSCFIAFGRFRFSVLRFLRLVVCSGVAPAALLLFLASWRGRLLALGVGLFLLG